MAKHPSLPLYVRQDLRTEPMTKIGPQGKEPYTIVGIDGDQLHIVDATGADMGKWGVKWFSHTPPEPPKLPPIKDMGGRPPYKKKK